MKHKRYGFTIVELLIVIVVIAILAAISIIAYSGIQNRANNSAIQNDIRNYGLKIETFNIDNGSFPRSVNDLNGIGLIISSGSYATHVNGLMYCLSSDRQTFSIAGASKDGVNGYYYTNAGGLKQRAWWAAGNPCSDFGIAAASGLFAAWTPPSQSWSSSRVYIQP